jgi:hypothetical protein
LPVSFAPCPIPKPPSTAVGPSSVVCRRSSTVYGSLV